MIARLFVFLALLALAGCDQQMKTATDAVARTLKDPASAQFRDVKRCGPKGEVFRGEVNSKNSYGAYAGFQHFYSDGISAAMSSEDFGIEELHERCLAEMEGKTAEEASRIAKGAAERQAKQIEADLEKLDSDAKAAVDKEIADRATDAAMSDPMHGDDEELTDADIASANAYAAKYGANGERDPSKCNGDYCPCAEKGDLAADLCQKVSSGRGLTDADADVGRSSRDTKAMLKRNGIGN